MKAKAKQAERAWEAVTGSLVFLGAGGGAAIAAGLVIPPIAPFAAAVAVAAGSFYFKRRATWAHEDPPSRDYEVPTDFRPPRPEVMMLLPPGPIPPGTAVVSLLHAAGASVEATEIAVERAMGASVAAQDDDDAAAADRRVATDRWRGSRRVRRVAGTVVTGHELWRPG